MHSSLHVLEARLAQASRRAGARLFLAAIAAALTIAGAGFLAAALWLALAAGSGPVAASVWLGGGLAGSGVLVMLLGSRYRRDPPPPPVACSSPDSVGIAALVEAFLAGLRSGRSAGARRDPGD